jgi:DNA repair protein RadC
MHPYEKTMSQLGIKSLAEEDRPREKLLLKGKSSLSDAELLAILIGSGTPGESAVTLSQKILKDSENNLHELGKRSLKELQKHKGIGEAKAITIAAALELGRRRQLSDIREKTKITSSRDAWLLIAPLLNDLNHEEFWILYLSRANQVKAKECISVGGTAGTVVDLKIIFKKALEAQAAAIIAVHNHPSGNLKPSSADIELTKKMKAAGTLLDMPVLDHLIISERGFYSFADEGLL